MYFRPNDGRGFITASTTKTLQPALTVVICILDYNASEGPFPAISARSRMIDEHGETSNLLSKQYVYSTTMSECVLTIALLTSRPNCIKEDIKLILVEV